jgi:hypothetical protein
MMVVVVEEATDMVDVDVATVLAFPVATHEQTEDTTLLGWPKIATKCQQRTIGFVWECTYQGDRLEADHRVAGHSSGIDQSTASLFAPLFFQKSWGWSLCIESRSVPGWL